jgi:hypothetical protein
MTEEEAGDSAIYRTGAREMRERAAEVAAAAYPDPAAMLRAIHAIPVDPTPQGPRATIEATGEDGATLVYGMRRAAMRGGLARRILAVALHMRTHGRAWEAAYLGGVADGLAHAAATKLEDVIAEIQKRRGEIERRADRAAEGEH